MRLPLWMALTLALAACRHEAKCTDPCSESSFSAVSGDSVICCPGQRAEPQLGGVICRCLAPLPPSERAK